MDSEMSAMIKITIVNRLIKFTLEWFLNKTITKLINRLFLSKFVISVILTNSDSVYGNELFN